MVMAHYNLLILYCFSDNIFQPYFLPKHLIFDDLYVNRQDLVHIFFFNSKDNSSSVNSFSLSQSSSSKENIFLLSNSNSFIIFIYFLLPFLFPIGVNITIYPFIFFFFWFIIHIKRIFIYMNGVISE